MVDAVAMIRASDGLIVYTNPSWDELFGYEAGELAGRPMSVVNAPTEQAPEERAQEILGALERQGSWRGAVHNIRKDGSHLWCEAHLSQFDHPEVGRAWIAVLRESTDRLAESESLRVAKDRYQAAFVHSPVPTALLTGDGRVADANDAFCALTGYEGGELVGRPLADITDPDDAAGDPAFYADVADGDGSRIAARRFRTKQGETVATTVRAIAVRESGEQPPSMILTATDPVPAPLNSQGSRAARAAAP